MSALIEHFRILSRWGLQWDTVFVALIIPVCILALADRRLRRLR